MNSPKILIVTEEPLRDNSYGFGRTLTNIFKHYPTENILFYISDYDYTHKDYFSKFTILKRNLFNLHCAHTRWYANSINHFLNFINYSVQYLRRNNVNVKKIVEFQPDIVLTVPMNYTTLLEGYLVSKKISKPLYIYMMDDIFVRRFIHIGSLTQDIVKLIFKKSAGWILISNYLLQEFKNRYDTFNKPSFILHNPIDLKKSSRDFFPLNREKYVIAYAGSIHGFHFDPLLKVAEAVYSLRKKGILVSLIIYTNSIFWDTYASYFMELEVENGGNISYDKLYSTLNGADLLLCTSSFDKKYKNLISTSVFTKISDYMASARPVWCLGPLYAANNKYLIDNGLGFNTNSDSIIEIEHFIISRITNRLDDFQIVQKQIKYLIKEYDETTIMQNLIKFILSTSAFA